MLGIMYSFCFFINEAAIFALVGKVIDFDSVPWYHLLLEGALRGTVKLRALANHCIFFFKTHLIMP